MKKGYIHNFFITVFLVITLTFSAILPAYAFESVVLSAEEVTFTSVIMNIGADETKRNITWYSDANASGEIRYAKASDVQTNGFDASCKISPAIAKATTKDGYYSYIFI